MDEIRWLLGVLFGRKPITIAKASANLDAEIEANFKRHTAQRAEWREQILRNGGADLSPWANVAPRTYGYEVLDMVREGLLVKRFDVRTGPLSHEYFTHYVLTDFARPMAEMMAD